MYTTTLLLRHYDKQRYGIFIRAIFSDCGARVVERSFRSAGKANLCADKRAIKLVCIQGLLSNKELRVLMLSEPTIVFNKR